MRYLKNMKIKVIIHQAEEGGYWAEVPAFQVALPKEIAGKNLLKTYMKQLRPD